MCFAIVRTCPALWFRSRSSLPDAKLCRRLCGKPTRTLRLSQNVNVLLKVQSHFSGPAFASDRRHTLRLCHTHSDGKALASAVQDNYNRGRFVRLCRSACGWLTQVPVALNALPCSLYTAHKWFAAAPETLKWVLARATSDGGAARDLATTVGRALPLLKGSKARRSALWSVIYCNAVSTVCLPAKPRLLRCLRLLYPSTARKNKKSS